MNFQELMNKRRAVNYFDPTRDVADELLTAVIETAARAPSGFNSQPWNVMILKDSDEKERLLPLAWNQPKIVEAPVVLMVLADRDGYKTGHPTFEKNWQQMLDTGTMTRDKREWFEGALASLYGWGDEASLAFAVKNAAFFGISLIYAAVDLGLDTHPMDGFDHEAVKKEFNIPDNYWVPMLIALGYKKEDVALTPPKWRKSYNEIVVSFGGRR